MRIHFTKAARIFSDATRSKDAKSGVSESDGSYPIPDIDALKRAIRAIGRSKNRANTMAHIKARAAALGAEHLLPEKWGRKGLTIRLRKAVLPAPPPDMHHDAPPAITRIAHAGDPAARHIASGPAANANFTHQEMSLPEKGKVSQNTSDPHELYGAAMAHKDWQDKIIDKNGGIQKHFGFHHVEASADRPLTHEDIAEGHRKGGLVVTTPMKGEARFHQKVAEKGGVSRMMDVSRATIAVRHPDDLPHVTQALREHGFHHGAAPEDRFARPTDAGYRDVQLTSADPHGHLGELQLHTLDHLEAKELGYSGHHGDAGHKHYEEMRTMPKRSDERTPEQNARHEELNEKSKLLYNEATRRMNGRDAAIHGTPMAKGMKHMSTQYKVLTPEQCKQSAHRDLRPGYYTFDGSPAIRRAHGDHPGVWHSGKWHFVSDYGKFMHGAQRIPKAQFGSLLAHHGGKMSITTGTKVP